MNEEVKILLAILILIGLMWVGVYFIKQEACNQRTVSFEDHRYGLFQGCMVKHNGKWLPLDNIRGFDDKG